MRRFVVFAFGGVVSCFSSEFPVVATVFVVNELVV